MNTRSTIIAALLVVELAIVGEVIATVRPSQSSSSPGQTTFLGTAFGSNLVEDGPHRVFSVGAHPVLIVDIGYADLTIVVSKTVRIDASLRASSDYGPFRSRAPIAARKDGATIHVMSNDQGRLSSGDDRMVTVVVPAATQVTVVSAGDIKAAGLRAETSIKSVGTGSVTLEDFRANALHVSTVNGDIVLDRISSGRLDVISRHGDIDATALLVRDGRVQTRDRITLRFAPGTNTLVSATTRDGSVSVSGNDVPPSRQLRLGTGRGRLDVLSRSGDINLDEDLPTS